MIDEIIKNQRNFFDSGNTLDVKSHWRTPSFRFNPTFKMFYLVRQIFQNHTDFAHIRFGCGFSQISVFPPEYAAVVYGDDGLSQKLLEYKFDYIFFTGGARVGKSV